MIVTLKRAQELKVTFPTLEWKDVSSPVDPEPRVLITTPTCPKCGYPSPEEKCLRCGTPTPQKISATKTAAAPTK